MATSDSCQARKGLLGDLRNEPSGWMRHTQRIGCRRLLVYSAASIILILIYILGGSHKITSHLTSISYANQTQGRQASCDRALESQIELLVEEYGNLLEGVTHVALIAVPVHS